MQGNGIITHGVTQMIQGWEVAQNYGYGWEMARMGSECTLSAVSYMHYGLTTEGVGE